MAPSLNSASLITRPFTDDLSSAQFRCSEINQSRPIFLNEKNPARGQIFTASPYPKFTFFFLHIFCFSLPLLSEGSNTSLKVKIREQK